MLRKIAVSGALACLMAAAIAVASADGASKTLLRGHTGQQHIVKLRKWNQAVQIVRFKVELRCRDGNALIDEESGFVRTPIHGGGHFSDVQIGSTDTVRIQGRVQGKAIKGRLRVKDRLGKARCDSRWVRFAAKP